MKAAQFEYHRAMAVEEAVELLAETAADDGRIIAGGQSLVPMMAFRLARPAHLIDINRIPGLNAVTTRGDKLCIGATVRHAMLERSRERGPLNRFLAYVAQNIAHPPIRNRGTFCGSVANSDPASEWCLLTVTLDAEIVATSRRGTRGLAAKSFYYGPMSTALAPDEMIVEVRLPIMPETARWGFAEVSRVAGGFAMAAAAVTWRVDDDRITDARVGVGGVEGAPRRCAAAEAELNGRQVGEIDMEKVAQAAARDVNPMDDGQYDADFKRHLARTVTARAVARALS
jgi:aerobic carbon-monoxide dehydrogenase medium subunit